MVNPLRIKRIVFIFCYAICFTSVFAGCSLLSKPKSAEEGTFNFGGTKEALTVLFSLRCGVSQESLGVIVPLLREAIEKRSPVGITFVPVTMEGLDEEFLENAALLCLMNHGGTPEQILPLFDDATRASYAKDHFRTLATLPNISTRDYLNCLDFGEGSRGATIADGARTRREITVVPVVRDTTGKVIRGDSKTLRGLLKIDA